MLDRARLDGRFTTLISALERTGLHAVDKVLAFQSIVDFTVKADDASELEAAVTAAGLVPTLSAAGPFTVFAPVNAAFEAIAEVTEGLTTEELANILAYHVVNGNVRSDALCVTDVPTLSTGNNIKIRLVDDVFTIENADGSTVSFVLTDIQGTNGVIHLINAVLLP